MAKEQLKYYKGEKSNPFEEVNETQGAWCQRYNRIASAFWNFECWWANGWEKYRKIEGTTWLYFFEQYKEPQSEFESFEDALVGYGFALKEEWCNNACKRYTLLLYDNAQLERFYKPLFNIVTEDELPSYYKWYKGEGQNPYKNILNTEKGRKANMWWELEHGHFMGTDNLHISNKQWQEHVQQKIERVAGASADEQQRYWDSYNEQ